METTITSRPDPLLQPPGFRFYPTEEELLSFYLRHRLAGTRPDVERFIPVVDIYSHHPRDLQRMAGVDDPEQWFFFCPRAAREAHGGRPARTTPSGYWKATGSPSWVFSSSSSSSSSSTTTTAAAGGDRRVIGEKRTMVFYTGRAPAGTKTRWKMNEYKAVVDDDVADHAPAAAGEPAPLRLRNEFSVCRVYISTGTLRCFDRRPLDLNDHAAGHDRPLAAPHHHRQPQRRQLVVVPPLPAANSTSRNNNNNNDQLAASGWAVQTTAENNPLDGPSSSSGLLRGMVFDDDDDGTGADDVDWDSLMVSPPPDVGDGFSFDADDLARMLS